MGGGDASGEEGLLVVDAFEGGEDILGVALVQPVEVEEGGVEFGQEFGSLGFVPFVEPAAVFCVEATALKIAGVGEGEHVFGGAGELKDDG